MREMQERLTIDPELAAAYRDAHLDYLGRRESVEEVAQIRGISAGGMPSRVKCLHVLVAHALGVGPGVNPLGDEALALLGDWGAHGPCVPRESAPGDGVTGDRPTSDGVRGDGTPEAR